MECTKLDEVTKEISTYNITGENTANVEDAVITISGTKPTGLSVQINSKDSNNEKHEKSIDDAISAKVGTELEKAKIKNEVKVYDSNDQNQLITDPANDKNDEFQGMTSIRIPKVASQDQSKLHSDSHDVVGGDTEYSMRCIKEYIR